MARTMVNDSAVTRGRILSVACPTLRRERTVRAPIVRTNAPVTKRDRVHHTENGHDVRAYKELMRLIERHRNECPNLVRKFSS